MGWKDELSALQSARFVPTVVLREATCSIEQFAPSFLADAALTSFAGELVAVVCDEDLPSSAAVVRARLEDGGEEIARRDVPPGDPSNPLTDDEIRGKLAVAVDGVQMESEEVWDMLSGLEREPDVSAVWPRLRASDRVAPRAAWVDVPS